MLLLSDHIMNKRNIPCVVSIAGTDPSGGAGIQADIKTISATGSYAASIITVLVAQNTQGVQSIYPISSSFVMEQLTSVFQDLNIHAVKIGMLYNKEIIDIVATAINKFKPENIVLDPVMIAKDGSPLLNLLDINFLKEKMFPLADILTPNLPEAEKILNHKITTLNDMALASETLGNRYQTNILIKGGHLNGEKSSDVLYSQSDKSITWFHSDRINTHNTHGTGCTLSAAIASYLAQNHSLKDSIQQAKLYLTKAIQAGSTIQIGKGNGPVDHFYFLRSAPSIYNR
jgi:hydroxymethylpyrimidine/phosphomethylpyrimidine kinase